MTSPPKKVPALLKPVVADKKALQSRMTELGKRPPKPALHQPKKGGKGK